MIGTIFLSTAETFSSPTVRLFAGPQDLCNICAHGILFTTGCRPRAVQDAAADSLAERLGEQALPSTLLRSLLAEEGGASGLRAAAACCGNQLVSCRAESAGGGSSDGSPQVCTGL